MKNAMIVIHKLNGGGAEHAACNLSLSLEQYYHMTLVAFDGRTITYPHCADTVDLGVPPTKKQPARAMLMPRRAMRLRKVKKQRKTDISVALLTAPGIVNALSKRKGEKSVMSIRNYLSVREGSGHMAKLRIRFAAMHSDCVVSVSRSAALDLTKNFGVPAERIKVIYNSVDPELLSRECDANAPAFGKEGPIVVTMGRLHEQKGHWHLIRAMAEVIKTVSDAKLMILGEGAYMDRLKALARELGIEENVYLPGYVVNPHGLVRKSDLFVLTSHYEGMPNAMLEAMACGLPVVSSDCTSGPREILAPDTDTEAVAHDMETAEYGILTPPLGKEWIGAGEPLNKAEQALAEAIRLMLTDEKTRTHYTEKAAERAKDFAPENIAAQWHDLLENL